MVSLMSFVGEQIVQPWNIFNSVQISSITICSRKPFEKNHGPRTKLITEFLLFQGTPRTAGPHCVGMWLRAAVAHVAGFLLPHRHRPPAFSSQKPHPRTSMCLPRWVKVSDIAFHTKGASSKQHGIPALYLCLTMFSGVIILCQVST